MLRFLILPVLLATSTYSLPQGAPTSVCDTMFPKHEDLPGQTSQPPFAIIPQYIQLSKNTPLKIVIGSQLGIQFQGFMIHARDQNNRIIGQFIDIPSNAKGLNCRAQDDTLTHESPSKKGPLELTWMPPNGFLGTIIFNATVAQSFDVFWVGLQSQPVVVLEKRDITDHTPSSGWFTDQQHTTPPHFNPTDAPKKHSGQDPFYADCFKEKGCFGSPVGCIESQDCLAVVATTVKGDRYEFEMKSGKEGAYVAFALSDDDKMGDDSVIECVKEGSQVKAYMSHTLNNPYDDERLPKMHVQLLNYSLADGEIYCKVHRETKTKLKGKEYDLVANKYYLLVASGRGVHADKVGYHDITRLPSGEKRYLSDVSEVGAAFNILVRLHGAFMLIAWVGTASLGILFARYYRQTWVGSQLCGKDQWFAWHRFFMVTTWTLTMAAFVLIFVEIRAWSAEKNPHAILGLCTTIICFFQPIGAFFRPHPGTPKRSIFNWLHWLAGNVAHILAIVTIFFAVKLQKAELPEWMDWILVAFVAFHVFVHLVLSILGCMSDRTTERRISSFPMKDLGSANGRNSVHLDRNTDAPKSTSRKLILGIYMFVIILLVVAMVVVIVLAPIEPTWKRFRAQMEK